MIYPSLFSHIMVNKKSSQILTNINGLQSDEKQKWMNTTISRILGLEEAYKIKISVICTEINMFGFWGLVEVLFV